MDQFFFDGLGNITVIGGTVRLDFLTFSPTETDANGRPQAVPAQRVIMSIEGFARATEKMQETVQTLSKIIQASREQAQGPPGTQASAAQVQGTPVKSAPAKPSGDPPPDASSKPFP
jgi:hypothetical protein